MGDRQNEELRLRYQAEALYQTADMLVFVDKSLFNETTGWRYYAYTPVGQPARYYISRQRGYSWSVLLVYTINSYLPCTGIKQGWFNADAFFR